TLSGKSRTRVVSRRGDAGLPMATLGGSGVADTSVTGAWTSTAAWTGSITAPFGLIAPMMAVKGRSHDGHLTPRPAILLGTENLCWQPGHSTPSGMVTPETGRAEENAMNWPRRA